jgi:hypothetical protein
MTTCVIFDVTKSLIPDKCALFMDRLRKQHPEAADEMQGIMRSYYLGSLTKDYMVQSFSIKLGLKPQEAADLDIDLEKVERYFGPIVRLLNKYNIRVAFMGNLGKEDSLIFDDYAKVNKIHVQIYSSKIGSMFGDGELSNETLSIISLAETAVIVTSDEQTAVQFSKLNISPVKFTNYESLMNSLFVVN